MRYFCITQYSKVDRIGWLFITITVKYSIQKSKFRSLIIFLGNPSRFPQRKKEKTSFLC